MKLIERFQPVLLVAGIGFFLLSFVGMGVAPWTTLSVLKPPSDFSPLSELEQEGREIFIREACWHCHTQFVRPVANEELRYGPVSDAAEYVYEIPQLFGTRRIGPDLARESGRRSDDWHLAHFHNPRSTVPWSIMPAFPWLFEEENGAMVPTRKAEALVAYIQSLGRTKAGLVAEHETAYRERFRVGNAPEPTPALLARGADLYARECAGCHNGSGNGQGLAKPFLEPPAQDLTTVNPTPEYVFTVLHLGVPGSAMPHFREHPARDLWAIAHYVPTLYREPFNPAASKKTEEVLQTGEALFADMCAACHGEQGRGDGEASSGLEPRPANFASLRPAVVHTFSVLMHGIPGTAMADFEDLSEDERWALAFYVEKLSGMEIPPSESSEPVVKAPAAEIPAASTPPPLNEAMLSAARAKYGSLCATCHGKQGDGKGPAGTVLRPPAANFTDATWKHGSSLVDIHKVVANGVPGTSMVGYSSFTADELWGLAYYVKGFSDEKFRMVAK